MSQHLDHRLVCAHNTGYRKQKSCAVTSVVYTYIVLILCVYDICIVICICNIIYDTDKCTRRVISTYIYLKELVSEIHECMLVCLYACMYVSIHACMHPCMYG